MSADNYISIRTEKEEGKEVWVGYHQFASDDEPQYKRPLFSASTIEEAIRLAQAEETEYGYCFIDI